jgi:hypothetical protein
MVTYDGIVINDINAMVYPLGILNTLSKSVCVKDVNEDIVYGYKYFGSVINRDRWLEERNMFIDYVLDFYGVGGVHSGVFSEFGEGLNRNDIILATNAIDSVKGVEIMYYDSIAREMVRDYILLSRGVSGIEYPIVSIR